MAEEKRTPLKIFYGSNDQLFSLENREVCKDPRYFQRLVEAMDKFDPEGKRARAIAAKYHENK
jgi:hypothetical protein